MSTLTLEDLNKASRIGGPSVLAIRTVLEPAAGPESVIAPAKYLDRSTPTYVIEDRFIGDKSQKTVLIDSRGSSSNRVESFITAAIKEGRGILGRLPHLKVTYKDGDDVREVFDTELPHRAFDGHVRVGRYEDKPVSKNVDYIAARNATLDDLMPLFEISPVTVMFGGWDSTRNRNQLRLASPFNGEIIGVLANQNSTNPADTFVHRSGARIDPLEASIKFTEAAVGEIKESIKDDVSEKLIKGFTSGKDKGNGSRIGLGAIPPSAAVNDLDGVAVSTILRTQVLSFSVLRTLHFGQGVEGDEAIRVLISAVILDAIAGSNQELNLRANCFLRESAEPETRLDLRYGKAKELEPITLELADELLEGAYQQAHEKAGVNWSGQTFEVIGNPAVIKSSSAETE